MTDYAVNEWTRNDLPRIGTPNPAHDSVVDGALDTVVHWLNANHPKPRPIDEAEFLDLYIDVISETSGLERMVLWSHRVWAKKIVERLNANVGVPSTGAASTHTRRTVMSISDRLDQIAERHGDVTIGEATRSRLLALDVPDMLAALRAVLDLCDSTPLRFRPYDGAEPFMVLGVPAIRSAIEAALGEES